MILSRDPEFQDLNFVLGRPASRTLRSIGTSARRSSPTSLEVFSKTIGMSTASHDLKQGNHGLKHDAIKKNRIVLSSH
jgi:hypothetical protein